MFKKEGFKKNLLRVKQLADQNLGRAEKSEIPEELLSLEKHVDHMKLVCKNTHQKLSACMVGQGLDQEKRLKKMPDAVLAGSMNESATLLGRDSLMGQMFQLCGGAVNSIAQEHMNFELELETQVLKDINNILEVDIPLIHKQKKQLNKVTLDYDSARARYQSSQKQNNVAGKGELKEEMEEAHHRVIQCKDQFSTDMMQFVAREADYSRILLDLIMAQKDYHQRALDTLLRVLPQMQETADFTPHMPVYKQSLEDHLQRTNRDIAVVIEECVITLLNFMEEEGLFRITGGSSKVKKLKAAFDSGLGMDMDDAISDIHSVAGALKLYLRELPEPLMTFALYNDWVQAAHQPPDQRLQALWLVLDKMPKINYNNLRYLIKFLSKLAENHEVNKMSASNIAIVMGPNLIWPPGEGGPSVMMSGMQSGIVEALVSNADWFFPGDVDFHKTARGTSSPAPSGKRLHAPPPPANHLQPRPRPKSVHAINMGLEHTTLSGSSSTLNAPQMPSSSSSRESSPNTKLSGSNGSKPSSASSSPKLHSINEAAIKAPVTLKEVASDSKGEDLVVRRDLARRSWNERPLAVTGESDLHLKHNELGRNRASSVDLMTKSVNGELEDKRSLDSALVMTESVSEPGTIGRSPLCRTLSFTRATTPPPKPPPPKGMHSDIYNTAFALQQLGQTGWSDYLTRARGILDGQSYYLPPVSSNSGCETGHSASSASSSSSAASAPSAAAAVGVREQSSAGVKGSGVNSDSSEIEEFNNPAGSSSGDSPVLPRVNDQFGVSTYDAQPAQSAVPVAAALAAPALEVCSITAPLSAAAAPVPAATMLAQPVNTDASLMTLSMTSSTGSLSLSPEGNGGPPTSPKLGRRHTRKPPAPLPPGSSHHERKHSSGSTFDFSGGGTLERGSRSHEGTLERPSRTSGGTLEHRLSGGHIERPSVPPPQPPQSPQSTLPRKQSHKRSASSDLVSVTISPPEERGVVNEVSRSISHEPRPAVPVRPDEVPVQDRPVSERPPIPDRPSSHPSSQQVTAGEQQTVQEKPSSPRPEKPQVPRQPRPDRPQLPPPDRPPLKEKPELPPPPANFNRQGSGRPPRPTPPVAPERRHHEPKAPLAQQEVTENKSDDVTEETHL